MSLLEQVGDSGWFCCRPCRFIVWIMASLEPLPALEAEVDTQQGRFEKLEFK